MKIKLVVIILLIFSCQISYSQINGKLIDINGDAVRKSFAVELEHQSTKQIYTTFSDVQGNWHVDVPVKLPSFFKVNVIVDKNYTFQKIIKSISEDEEVTLVLGKVVDKYTHKINELLLKVDDLKKRNNTLIKRLNGTSNDTTSQMLLNEIEQKQRAYYELENKLQNKNIDLLDANDSILKYEKKLYEYEAKIKKLEREYDIAHMIAVNFRAISYSEDKIKFSFHLALDNGESILTKYETIHVSVYRLKTVNGTKKSKTEKIILSNNDTIKILSVNPKQDILIELTTQENEFFSYSNNYYIEVKHSDFSKPMLYKEIYNLKEQFKDTFYPQYFKKSENKIIKKFTIKSKIINLLVYDYNAQPDKDSVLLKLNGQIIDKIEAGKEGDYKKEIQLQNNENYLIIHSLSEGSEPTTTVRIKIIDNEDNIYVVNSGLSEGENSMILLYVEKE